MSKYVSDFFLLSNVLRSTGPSNLPDMRPQAWSDNVRYRWKNVCAAGKDLAGGAEGAISDPCIQINAHVRASTVQAEESPVHLGRDEQGRVRHNLLVHDAAGGIGQMSPGGEQSYLSKGPIDKGYSDMKSWAWLDFYKKHVLEGRPCPTSLPQSHICVATEMRGITDYHTPVSGLNYTCCERWKQAFEAIEQDRDFDQPNKPLAEEWIRNRLEYIVHYVAI